jgi:hypothetical protein
MRQKEVNSFKELTSFMKSQFNITNGTQRL